MEHTIQELESRQYATSAQVIREAFQTVADDFGFTVENNPTNGAFLQEEKLHEESRRGVRMFGLFAEGRQVGFAAVEKKDDALYYLEKLAVIPAYRHHGFGTRLMDYVRDFVKQSGGSVISIGIIDENDVLKRWYSRYGFRQTGTKRFDHLSFTVCFMTLSV